MNTLRTYLKEIGEFEVLTAAEEVDLATRYRIGKDAQKELDENYDNLSPEQRSSLQDLVADGDYAREELINHNLKLVVSIAKNYHNAHMDLGDLIDEGNLGLLTAVDKFDPNYGCRFSTCATPWIKQAITKAIIDNGKNIRIPAHIYQLLSKYRKAVEELSKDGHTVTDEEIAKYLNIEVEKVDNLKQWRHDTVSLSTPLGDESEDTLEDLQADDDHENPFQYTERLERERVIQEMISKLKPRTQIIMKMRYGLGKDGDPEEFKSEHTLEEIGAYLGITRERVRQIEKETLIELKLNWKASK